MKNRSLFGILLLVLIASFQINLLPAKALKIGGSYKLTKLDKNTDQSFTIEFSPLGKGSDERKLFIKTRNIHVTFKVGTEYRISAEVYSETDKLIYPSQIAVLSKSMKPKDTIWLVSEEYRQKSHAENFLKMHDPKTDYMLF